MTVRQAGILALVLLVAIAVSIAYSTLGAGFIAYACWPEWDRGDRPIPGLCFVATAPLRPGWALLHDDELRWYSPWYGAYSDESDRSFRLIPTVCRSEATLS